MKQLLGVLLAAMFVAQPLGAWAESSVSHPAFSDQVWLEQLELDVVEMQTNGLVIHHNGASKAKVLDVYFDGEELVRNIHYTIHNLEDGGAKITFTTSFLRRQPHDVYPIYIVMTKYSLETTFTIDASNSDYDAEPPRVNW